MSALTQGANKYIRTATATIENAHSAHWAAFIVTSVSGIVFFNWHNDSNDVE